MKKEQKTKKKQGFTLIELLVTMSLASLLVPAALYLNIHLMGNAARGANLNNAASEARVFQQFFMQKINASGKNTRPTKDGNMVVIELYNETTEEWKDAALAYDEKKREILYYAPGTGSDTYSDPITVAESIYRNGDEPIFEPVGKNGSIRCNLYTGKHSPTNRIKTAGYFTTPGVFIELTATPRNNGTMTNES